MTSYPVKRWIKCLVTRSISSMDTALYFIRHIYILKSKVYLFIKQTPEQFMRLILNDKISFDQKTPRTFRVQIYGILSQTCLPKGQSSRVWWENTGPSYQQTSVIRLTDAMRIHHNIHICSLQPQRITRSPCRLHMDINSPDMTPKTKIALSL